MTILSSGKDWVRLASGHWVYEIWNLNPYQLRRVQMFLRNNCVGSAWGILKQYPFTKESISDYLTRQCSRSSAGTALVL